MTPLLFLDIDGVLNALGGETAWPDSFDVTVRPDGRPFKLTLSRHMADAIKSLNAEIIWCTTWQHEADMVGNLVGIDAPYLALGAGWKRFAVENKLADDPRPFLWFEDAPTLYGMELKLFSVDHLPPRFLCNPNPAIGITPTDIDQARQWIKEL